MTAACPMCAKVTPWKDNPYRPFCSERCKLKDLAAWASEGYVIAGKAFEVHNREDNDNSGEPDKDFFHRQW